MTRRVAVTGVGIACALGGNQQQVWGRALEGQGGIGRLRLFDSSGCLSEVAGEMATLPPLPPLPSAERRRMSRTDHLCLASAVEAVGQARLAAEELADFGVSLGTSTGGMLESEAYCRETVEKGHAAARASRLLRLPSSSPADAVARLLKTRGPRLSNMTACASSALSIGFAADLIRDGETRGMIAGGGDALCAMTYAGFNSLRLVDPRPCRPFDAARQGLSLGEGAGILVLEDWDHALARRARPLAELLDYGASCDAQHMTAPHPEGRGAAAAMREALARAGLHSGQVGHVNTHGTGTPLNDATEIRAILSVFGEEMAAHLPLTASKSMIGHLLGGSGGAEAVLLVLSLRHQTLPPTLGWRQSDPDARLDIVAGRSRPASFDIGLSNSFGFGGTNCSLLFQKAP